MYNRRSFIQSCTLGAISALALPISAKASDDKTVSAAGGPAPSPQQIEGHAGPVIEVVYAWFCGHCASFHKDTLPQIRKQFIETGRARLIYTPYIENPTSFMISMIARPLNMQDFQTFSSRIFDKQKTLAQAPYPEKMVEEIARSMNISTPNLNKLTDSENLDAKIILEQSLRIRHSDVTGTPALIAKKIWYPSNHQSALSFIESEIQPT